MDVVLALRSPVASAAETAPVGHTARTDWVGVCRFPAHLAFAIATGSCGH